MTINNLRKIGINACSYYNSNNIISIEDLNHAGYETADGIKPFYFTFYKTVGYVENDEYD